MRMRVVVFLDEAPASSIREIGTRSSRKSSEARHPHRTLAGGNEKGGQGFAENHEMVGLWKKNFFSLRTLSPSQR